MTRSPDEITKALLEPFPKSAIKTRTDRGKALGYIEAHTVIRRLIEATGNAFDVAVIDQQVQPWTQTRNGTPQLMVTARVRLTIPGMGSREHMGVQIVQEGGGEDMWKGAISDALKKAATLFGVGLDLYGPDYEAGEVDDRAVSQRPSPRQDGPQKPTNAPGRNKASDRQKEMITERWGALRLDPMKLFPQCRKWYGVEWRDLDRDNAEDMIRRLDQKITAASPQGVTPQPPDDEPEQAGMSDAEIHATRLAIDADIQEASIASMGGNDRWTN